MLMWTVCVGTVPEWSLSYSNGIFRPQGERQIKDFENKDVNLISGG